MRQSIASEAQQGS